MKRLLVILFGAALLAMPFAEPTQARGGRGGGRGAGRSGAGISGAGQGRSGSGSSKEQQRKRDLNRLEERDSLTDGKLRRRSR